MLTGASDEADVLDAVRGGASGYLLKDAPLPEIVAAIRATAAGHSTIGARVAGHLLRSVRLNDAGLSTGVARKLPALSLRERDVLTRVTNGCGNSEIAGRV
jgi:DNA-binding NarL/FixJ family response regulator